MKEIKEDPNEFSWVGSLHIVKMPMFYKSIYSFSAIPIKIPPSYFIDIDKLILKFIWRGKRTRVADTILKKNKRLTLPNFKNYYRATVNQDNEILVKEQIN